MVPNNQILFVDTFSNRMYQSQTMVLKGGGLDDEPNILF